MKTIIVYVILLVAVSHQFVFAEANVLDFDRDFLTECEVDNGRIRPLIGTSASCETDNLFFIDALRSKDIDKAPQSYRIVSSKVQIPIVHKADGVEMEAYLYCIRFQNENDLARMNELYRTIATNSYATGLIHGKKMPITCHYFTCGNILVLFSYYGLPMYYKDFEPEVFIEKLKIECPCGGTIGKNDENGGKVERSDHFLDAYKKQEKCANKSVEGTP